MDGKRTVVLVDDNSANLKIIIQAYKDEFRCIPFISGRDVIEYFKEGNTADIILLDIDMPGLNGFDTIKILKGIDESKNVPVIFLTGRIDTDSEIKGLDLGAVDYLSKPINPALARKRINMHIDLMRYNNNLEELVDAKTKTISKLTEITVLTTAAIVESRDSETGGHINRTSGFVDVIAKKMLEKGIYPSEINKNTVEHLRLSAPLHDIGKVGISDSILLKPSPLSREEYEAMKAHTIIGYNALALAIQKMGEESFLDMAAELALYHHEKWDGTGYPKGLKGDKIPVCARIMAVADVYDALISERPYKAPFSDAKAHNIILESSETHFDPAIIEIFKEVSGEMRYISTKFAPA